MFMIIYSFHRCSGRNVKQSVNIQSTDYLIIHNVLGEDMNMTVTLQVQVVIP